MTTEARILLIDDDAILSELMGLQLELEGFEVVHATNGASGLEKLAEGGIDAIVLDLMMPVMDGMQFLLEADRRGNKLPPVILLSANPIAAQDQQALPDTVKEVVRKPVQQQTLLDCLRRHLAGP